MNYSDALPIAEFFAAELSPVCEEEYCRIAGGVRRKKQDVHDIEIVCAPILKAPRPVFGVSVKDLPKTMLEQTLNDLVEREYLWFKSGASRNRKYWIRLDQFGMETVIDFVLDLWITMPPAQFGVNYVIRTGPSSPSNHFSKWAVTQRSKGGALPDGYRVKFAAVWRDQQLDAQDKPFPGESPLAMPNEEDFLDFIGVTALPWDRRADWGRYTR